MFVIGYLYNNNGMGSWCWEAAHALAETQEKVLLVCSEEIKLKLPENSSVEIICFNPSPENVSTGILGRISERLSAKSSGFVYQLHEHLQDLGIKPTAYYLNQSNLQDPRVEVPQYIQAWACPSSLKGYISKLGKLTGWKISKASFWLSLDAVGWWRKDWRAYRDATSVMACTQKLASELAKHNIRVQVVHPGTNTCETKPLENKVKQPRLLIAALSLEEPRKRVKWMMEALKSNYEKNYNITLVGQASDSFQQWVLSNNFPATFTGQITRKELQSLMVEHDLFLFGSCLDDWGYVLIEAMSQGLIPIAPNVSPFNEIVGDSSYLFSPYGKKDFLTKVDLAINSNLAEKRQLAWARSQHLFSRKVFGRNLVEVFSN
jgi:glycosyltransferase involved in cell wall biosynthesis